MPAAIACLGVFGVTSTPLTRTRPRDGGSAPTMMRASSVRPAPSNPARPTISPPHTREADIVDAGSTRDVLEAQQFAARRASPSWIVIADLTVRHQPDQRLERRLGEREGPHRPAIAQHRDALANLGELAHAMRDVDDRHAGAGHAADDLEQAIDLPRRQCRRRLVHHEHAGAPEQGLRHFDHLLFGDAEAIDAAIRIDLQAHFVQAAASRLAKAGAVDDARPSRLVAEQDVFGDGELRNEAQFLVDGRDAERLGVARRSDRHRRALEKDFPGILRVRAAENLHQRRLARAVLAEEHVHFARAEVEIDAVERNDAGERFANAAHLQRRPGGGLIRHQMAAGRAAGAIILQIVRRHNRPQVSQLASRDPCTRAAGDQGTARCCRSRSASRVPACCNRSSTSSSNSV